jgi:hypothetical protein
MVVSFVKGIRLQTIGRNDTGTWLHVNIGLEQTGWIAAEIVSFTEDIFNLLVFDAPPTPILPTKSPTASPMQISVSNNGGETEIEIRVRGIAHKEKFTVNVFSPTNVVVITANGNAHNTNGSGHVLIDIKNLPPGVYTITVRSESGLFAQTTWRKY